MIIMKEKIPFIERVILKNYKSIASCNVQLGPLQFLVGRNGSGKSNFLDALAFVRDALADNLRYAFDNRGGINEVRRRSGGHPQNFGMRLDFNLDDGTSGMFAFEISTAKDKEFYVKREMATLNTLKKGRVTINGYETVDGILNHKDKTRFPPVPRDRLYLQSMGALDEYRSLLDAMRTIVIYNLNLNVMTYYEKAEARSWLMGDGANIAASVAALRPQTKDRIREYLTLVVPFVTDFRSQGVYRGARILEFLQHVGGQKHPWRFGAINMSDGTLRALGILVALLQEQEDSKGGSPLLVGIEEPETALHVQAASALLDAINESSEKRQVIITTHNAEMLDHEKITPSQILPVELRESKTLIAPLRDVSKEMLQKHLATAGELLRQDKLRPNIQIFSKKDTPLFSKQ